LKSDGEMMEILAAYDLTGSVRSAGVLVGCSHHTVAAHVAARDAGRAVGTPARRPQITDPFLDKIEEWVEASKGRIRADKAHEKLVALGYGGSDRSTRRAVAEVKAAFRLGHARVHRPWVTEPGMWLQYDFGDGPTVEGRATVLFVAWLAWCRFRVVIALRDRTQPSVIAALDRTFRLVGGVPTFVLTENVRRHIFGVLWPTALCDQRRPTPGIIGESASVGHITLRVRTASSEAFRRNARRGGGGVPPKHRARCFAAPRSLPWC